MALLKIDKKNRAQSADDEADGRSGKECQKRHWPHHSAACAHVTRVEALLSTMLQRSTEPDWQVGRNDFVAGSLAAALSFFVRAKVVMSDKSNGLCMPLETYEDIVVVLHAQGRYAEALELCENWEAVELACQTSFRTSQIYAAATYAALNDVSRGISMLKKLIEALSSITEGAARNSTLCKAHVCLSGLYLDCGDAGSAESQLDLADERAGTCYDFHARASADLLAAMHCNRAALYTYRGEWVLAFDQYERALENIRDFLRGDGVEHWCTLPILHGLACLCRLQGDEELAVRQGQHTLEIACRKIGFAHPHAALYREVWS